MANHTVTVVLSRWNGNSAARRQLEADLLAALSHLPNVALCLLPNLCDLVPKEYSGLEQLKERPNDLVVLAWLYPRALYWLLRSYGFQGKGVALEPTSLQQPDGTSLTEKVSTLEADSFGEENKDETARTIYCLRLDLNKDVRSYVETIQQAVKNLLACKPSDRAGSELSTSNSAAAFPSAEAETACEKTISLNSDQEVLRQRWFPVVDYDRCTQCLECIDFCLFGVYGFDESGKIFVEEPDNCRPGCPACSRICPQGAIMFPLHSNSVIAGGPGTFEDLKVDLSQIFGGKSQKELAEEERRLCQWQQPAEPGAKMSSASGGKDEADTNTFELTLNGKPEKEANGSDSEEADKAEAENQPEEKVRVQENRRLEKTQTAPQDRTETDELDELIERLDELDL